MSYYLPQSGPPVMDDFFFRPLVSSDNFLNVEFAHPYYVENVTSHTQSPFLQSPRPICHQQLPDAEHLMEMAETEHRLSYLGDIRYCELEPVSPRPIILPLIPDAERLQLIAANEDDLPSIFLPSAPTSAASYSPLFGPEPLRDSFPSTVRMNGGNEGSYVPCVDANFLNSHGGASMPHCSLDLLDNTPLLLEELAFPWSSTFSTGADYQTYRAGFENFEACHPSPPHIPSRFRPFKESDEGLDEDDDVLCYFLPTALKLALDTVNYS